MAANSGTLRLEIVVDDKGSAKIKQISGETVRQVQAMEKASVGYTQRLKSAWASAKGAWLEIAAGVIAVSKAYDLMHRAAQFQERERAFANMAASHGVAADKIIADLKRISKGTVDTMTLMEKAGSAMTLGIQAEKLSELMEIARASAKITGQSVTQAFEDISLAVGRQSKMILDNLGIIVRVEEANKRYAKQMGIVGRELTEAEKKQAFLNATLEAGREIVERVGDAQDSAAEKLQRWKAQYQDAAIVIGKVFLNVVQGIETALFAASAGLGKVVAWAADKSADLAEKFAKIPLIGGLIGKYAEKLRGLESTAKMWTEFSAEKTVTAWDTMTAVWQQAEPVRLKVAQDLREQGTAAEETAQKIQALAEKTKTDEQTRADATATMYQESGLEAEAFYRDEVNKLVERATAWKQAGADIGSINEWLYGRLDQLQQQATGKGETEIVRWLDITKHYSDTLVADLEAKQAAANEKFTAIASKIEELDGDKIEIQVKLYDEDFFARIGDMKAELQSLYDMIANAPALNVGGASADSAALREHDYLTAIWGSEEEAIRRKKIYQDELSAPVGFGSWDWGAPIQWQPVVSGPVSNASNVTINTTVNNLGQGYNEYTLSREIAALVQRNTQRGL